MGCDGGEQTHGTWRKLVAVCPWTRHPELQQGTGSPVPWLPVHGRQDQLPSRLMGPHISLS